MRGYYFPLMTERGPVCVIEAASSGVVVDTTSVCVPSDLGAMKRF